MKNSSLTEERIVYSFAAVQRAFLAYAYTHQRAVAAWRLPHQSKQHVIVDLSDQPRLPNLPLELLPTGFIAQPFSTERESVFIQADLHYTLGDNTWTSPWSGETMAQTEAIRSIEDYLSSNKTAAVPYATSPTGIGTKQSGMPTAQTQFVQTVAEAIQAIEEGQFHKVVPSRQKLVSLPIEFDITAAFQRLCEAYPAAFVSVFSLPGVGTWLGASPETLVSTYPQDSRMMFRTMALAGTQVAQGDNPLKHAIWRQKEIEEQAMVSRYIINCFKKIRLREFEEYGPKTVAAGNLLHLRTDFTVDMTDTNFADLGSTMLQLLHPTSAVCGMPKEPAQAFLYEQEDYDRSFFSGYLGPVNVDEATHVFVNLRCAQLLTQQAVLYAGAGVTVDSDPEKEWEETEAKMRTLWKVINRK